MSLVEPELSDQERAEELETYLDAFAGEFGTSPMLLPLDGEGKEPIIKGRCRLDSDEAGELLVTANEAVRCIREDGARGFCLYAGREDHGTENVCFIEIDDPLAFEDDVVPTTFEVLSGSGAGPHLTFRNDGSVKNAKIKGETVTNGATEIGSVRSHNQYVVLPGSIHPSGGVYVVEDTRPITTLCENDLPAEMRPVRARSDPSTSHSAREPIDVQLLETTAEDLAIAESAIEEFRVDDHTTPRAFAYLIDLLRGQYAKRGFEGDRSAAEECLASKLYGVLRAADVPADRRVAVIHALIDAYCSDHKITDSGEYRKWVERGERYRTRTVDSAIRGFDLERFQRWQRKRSDPYQRTDDYSITTYDVVLKALWGVWDERPGYPPKSEVIDVAQGLDPDRARRSHENALKRLQYEFGQVKLAYVGGNDYVYYPAREPDPETAEWVKYSGEMYEP